jgi:hypothetical protein
VVHLRENNGFSVPAQAFRLLVQDSNGLYILDPSISDQTVRVAGPWFVLFWSTSSTWLKAVAATPEDVGQFGITLDVTSNAGETTQCTCTGSISWTGFSGDSLIINGAVVDRGATTVSLKQHPCGNSASMLFVTELLAGLGQRLWSRAFSSSEMDCRGSTSFAVDPASNPGAYVEHPIGTAGLSWSDPVAGEQMSISCSSSLSVGRADTCMLDATATSYSIATEATESVVRITGGSGRSGFAHLGAGAPTPLNILLLKPTQVSLNYDGARVTALITPNDPVQQYWLRSSDDRCNILATPKFVALQQPIKTPTQQDVGGDTTGPVWGVPPSTAWTLEQDWSTQASPALVAAQSCDSVSIGIGQQCASTTQDVVLLSP